MSFTSVFKAGECLILGTADGQIVIQVHSKVALTVDAPEEVHTGWMQAPEVVENEPVHSLAKVDAQLSTGGQTLSLRHNEAKFAVICCYCGHPDTRSDMCDHEIALRDAIVESTKDTQE